LFKVRHYPRSFSLDTYYEVCIIKIYAEKLVYFAVGERRGGFSCPDAGAPSPR